MFFSDFASIRIANVAPLEATGAELAFGAKVGGYALHKSYKLLFCFLVAVLTVVLSGFSFKSKGAKYATPISAAVVAVFMLVVTLGDPFKFVNGDGLAAYSIKYVFAGVITVTALLFASMLYEKEKRMLKKVKGMYERTYPELLFLDASPEAATG